MGIIGLMSTLITASHAGVILNEINYNPAASSPAEVALGLEDNNEFEFLELFNTGDTAVNLSGWRLEGAVTFEFPPGASIAPNGYFLLARDADSLVVRYPQASPDGDYSGRLSNEGETIQLLDSTGVIVEEVNYSFEHPWPEFANGHGGTIVRTHADGSSTSSTSWGTGRSVGGTPGAPNDPAPGPVVINELLPHTDEPLEDAIEFKNISGDPVDMTGWLLTDSILEPGRFAFGSTVIPAGGYSVVTQIQTDAPGNPRVPFSLNSYRGDSLYLFQINQNGEIIRLSDHVIFPPTENGVSYGRYPDGTGPFANLSAMTLGTSIKATDPPFAIDVFREAVGAENAIPAIGPVILRSLQIEPPDLLPEFIQITNISDEDVPLFDPNNPGNTWGVEDAVTLEFPPGITMAPGESIFLTETTPELFRAGWNAPESVRVLGPWTGRLDNSGESLRLYRPDRPQTTPPDIGLVPRLEADFVLYRPTSEWPQDIYASGKFLTRTQPWGPAMDPSSWTSADIIEFQMPSGDPIELTIVMVSETGYEVRYTIPGPGTYDLQSSTSLSGDWLSSPLITGPTQGSVDLRPAMDPSSQRYFRIIKVE